MTESVQCFVYKGSLKEDHFIYVAEELNLAQLDQNLPAAIVKLLGELQFVIDFELSADRKLAQAEASQVLADIKQQGFYLQMPKKDMRAEEDRLFN